MSASFRAVKEQWHEGMDEFVDQGTLIQILEYVGEQVEGYTQSTEYADLMVFWIDEGHEFIKYIQSSKFNSYALSNALEIEDTPDLVHLIVAMQENTRAMEQALDEDGSLRFYLD